MRFAGRNALLWKRLVYVTLHSGGDAVWTKLCYACRCFFVCSLFIYGETDDNGVGGRPAARDQLHTGCPNLEDGLGQA